MSEPLDAAVGPRELARLSPGPHPGVTRTIAIPPSPSTFGFGGGRVAIGYDDGRMRVVDLGTGAMLIDVASEAAPVCALALSGRWLVAAVDDRVEVWDTLTATRLAVHPPHPAPIVALAIEANLKWVATIDRASPGVRIADLRTGVEQARVGRIATRADAAPEPTDSAEPPPERGLRTALAAFSAFRVMHADVGAADDEVERVLHGVIRAAWQSGDPHAFRPAPPTSGLPLGVAGWGLVPGAEVAAQRLDGAAALVEQAVRAIPPHERERMRPTVAREAWRLDLEATAEDIGCHAVAWLAAGPGQDLGFLVVEHDDGVGVWDVLVPERVAHQPGTLLGAEADQVLLVDPVHAEVRAWNVPTGAVRSQPLPPGRLVLSLDTVDEIDLPGASAPLAPPGIDPSGGSDPPAPRSPPGIVIVDDAYLSVVGFGRSTVRIPAGIGRLGTLVARVGDDVISASRSTLRVCPFAELAVDDPRAGLPIQAVAVHPEGRWVATLRVLDDHDEMRVETWSPDGPGGPLRVLPGTVPLAEGLGVGANGRTWAAGAVVRVWDEAGEELPLEPEWRSARVVGRWAHAGSRLLDLETGDTRPAPPVSADRLVVAHGDRLFSVGEDGLDVLAADATTLIHREEFVPGAMAPVAIHPLPGVDGALLVLADGSVAAWSAATGLVRPWDGVVCGAAVAPDGRVALAVLEAEEPLRARVELWDGALVAPALVARWPASGGAAVVGVGGRFLAWGDPTGQLVLVDIG